MIKAVCMFRLDKNKDEKSFEVFFKKHVEDAKKLKNLKKYTIARRIDDNDTNNYYRINELYYESVKAAEESFSSDEAKEATDELMQWVKDFTCIIVEEKEVL